MTLRVSLVVAVALAAWDVVGLTLLGVVAFGVEALLILCVDVVEFDGGTVVSAFVVGTVALDAAAVVFKAAVVVGAADGVVSSTRTYETATFAVAKPLSAPKSLSGRQRRALSLPM